MRTDVLAAVPWDTSRQTTRPAGRKPALNHPHEVTAQYAQEQLPELLETADHGQEIEIARDGKPSYKLFIVPPASERAHGKRIPGAGIGELVVPTDEEWRAMKEEDAR